MEEFTAYMKALVLLQLEAGLDSERKTKPELLLAKAGMSHKQIAEMLDKSPAAVAKAVSRANKK